MKRSRKGLKRRYGRSLVVGKWYIELKRHGRMVDRWGPFHTQNEAYKFRDKVMMNRGTAPTPGEFVTLPMKKVR